MATAAPCWPPTRSPSPSSSARSWSPRPRWWSASAAPAGWNASSCAGWRWPPRWPPCCSWSSWARWPSAPRPCPNPGEAAAVSLAVLTLGIGAAILRYRLYDLDRIVSRTLSYGLLTLLLGGCYAVLVLGLSRLLGRDSRLVVAVATLAVAAAFQPARRRVQLAVDRRFNRRRYDAARTIEAFSTRLRAQVDLETLTAELLAVVNQTMEPTSASLWLRPTPVGGRALRPTSGPTALGPSRGGL
jgi:hypothetical protein